MRVKHGWAMTLGNAGGWMIMEGGWRRKLMTIALMNLDRKTNEKLDMSIAIISYHIIFSKKSLPPKHLTWWIWNVMPWDSESRDSMRFSCSSHFHPFFTVHRGCFKMGLLRVDLPYAKCWAGTNPIKSFWACCFFLQIQLWVYLQAVYLTKKPAMYLAPYL